MRANASAAVAPAIEPKREDVRGIRRGEDQNFLESRPRRARSEPEEAAGIGRAEILVG